MSRGWPTWSMGQFSAMGILSVAAVSGMVVCNIGEQSCCFSALVSMSDCPIRLGCVCVWPEAGYMHFDL